jgi:hypothetical protein
MWNEVEQALNDLKSCVSEYKKYNYDYAIKERKYRVALSQKLTELRAAGEKVTHLADIARGIPEIAQLRFDRDIAEGLKKSAEEGINYYKIKVRTLEGQLQREWGQAKYE